MFPAPQVFPPNTSASGWPCLHRQISPIPASPLLFAAPHQYKALGWEETTWEEVSLGVGTAIPPRMASGQGPAVTPGCVTAGSEERPGQDPVLMHLLE